MRSKKPCCEKLEWFSKEALIRFFISFMIIMAGVITTYHATIYGIKSDLATKADAQVVAGLDNRLIRIEAILNERIATKARSAAGP